MAEHAQSEFGFMTVANTARVQREKGAPITVIIGNPPYNMGQQNENDNNKNRKYAVVDSRIHDTYAADSKASLKNKLSDAYVKFFRWATDRLEDRDGIVCFVSNNSFVDQLAFDGMRKHLLKDFTHIYHVDLHGNVRKNPKLSGTTHNVFGIQVGVGITVAVRKREGEAPPEPQLRYHRVPEFWRKEEKLGMLLENASASHVSWQELMPNATNAWLVALHNTEFTSLIPLGEQGVKKGDSSATGAIFQLYSLGVATNRDAHAYNFDRAVLATRVETFIEIYNRAVDTMKARGDKVSSDALIDTTDARIKWTFRTKEDLRKGTYCSLDESHYRTSLYRPFTKMALYFDHFWNERRYQQHRIFPTPETDLENSVISVSGAGSNKPFHTLQVSCIPCLDMLEKTQCFPFYVYDEDGTNRRENITDWALAQFRARYKSKIQNRKSKIDKWDIFYYVYGLLHHPGYREKYGDCLKRELPRIPFAPDFRTFSDAGRALAHWHLDYEDIEPYPLKWEEAKDAPLSYRVEDTMRLSKDKTVLTVNPTLTLVGIPPEAFEYRLGNRSALDWVIDQYRVKTDKRSGITSDPNCADDPEYIVRLIGQVIRVSLETVHIVKSLPQDFGG